MVYPRMYGETRYHSVLLRPRSGLSPHVRGNPEAGTVDLSRVGSIPACTGKPVEIHVEQPTGEVYPRMYGETCNCQLHARANRGLSPHVRGNR